MRIILKVEGIKPVAPVRKLASACWTCLPLKAYERESGREKRARQITVSIITIWRMTTESEGKIIGDRCKNSFTSKNSKKFTAARKRPFCTARFLEIQLPRQVFLREERTGCMVQFCEEWHVWIYLSVNQWCAHVHYFQKAQTHLKWIYNISYSLFLRSDSVCVYFMSFLEFEINIRSTFLLNHCEKP